MKIVRLYADADGESHFEDLEVEFVRTSSSGRISALEPATGVMFREVQPGYAADWHKAPRRQYVINLDAAAELTSSDGEVRVLGPGQILLIEDTSGKGHLARNVGDGIRSCIYVTLD